MTVIRDAWIVVVQGPDGSSAEEVMTVERADADAPPVIEFTDGTRITCVERVGQAPE